MGMVSKDPSRFQPEKDRLNGIKPVEVLITKYNHNFFNRMTLFPLKEREERKPKSNKRDQTTSRNGKENVKVKHMRVRGLQGEAVSREKVRRCTRKN